ncbi:uncharacterized protein F5Z01DRAFT_434545 [Emericellopsis atlantica]|uniref:CFEM domain-containing protein n=1 Tax=Emericellopsis atlantica TaxID=2614577 RepID=A0A9P7ZE05_9HYPO|nr:uncharacterized protein F5Z01DRAFT_434545 [Emericellopsis atlantica]KAG9249917.1 hypothetical protein F5Z01DRAFT_434545 [Emericellopsis atlantica]
MRRRLLIVVLAAAARATTTTDLKALQEKLPPCSLSCIVKGVEQFGCAITDLECQCRNIEALTAEVSPCLVSDGCSFEEITDTAAAVAGICADIIAAGTTAQATPSTSQTVPETTSEPVGTPTPDSATSYGAGIVGVVLLAAAAAL